MSISMINRRSLFALVALLTILPASAHHDPRAPRSMKPVLDQYSPKPMDVKNVPDFADYSKQGPSNTPLQAGLQSATLPTETRMKLVVEYPVSATTSVPGDLFEGHVKEDIFLG